MRFQKWISLIVIMAFVATTMPTFSHAAMPHDPATPIVKTEQIKAPTHKGCAGHNDEGQKADNTKSTTEKDVRKTACCDGKFCKCIGGSCNGSSQILSFNYFDLVSPVAIKNHAPFDEQIFSSDYLSRIKRPPRA